MQNPDSWESIQPEMLNNPDKQVTVVPRKMHLALGIALVTLIMSIGILIAVVRSRTDTQIVPINTVESLPVGSLFRVTGRVTFRDSASRRFWIQDETGALVVPALTASGLPAVGTSVMIAAQKGGTYKSTEGPGSFDLRQVHIEKTSRTIQLPSAYPVTLRNLPDPSQNGIRIQFEAVVHSAAYGSSGRFEMSIGELGPESKIIFEAPPSHPNQLVNATVRFTAVPEQTRNSSGGVIQQSFFVSNENDVEVIKGAPVTVPLFSIRDIYRQDRPGEGHAVRVRGIASRMEGRSLLIEDEWGAIACNLSQDANFAAGSAVEVEGFLSRDGLAWDLYHSTVSILGRSFQELQTTRGLPTGLQHVAQVRALSPARAAEAIPVHLRGVTTYHDPIWRHIFIQDGTGGIYVKYSGEHSDIKLGQKIDLIGVTGAGEFAPVVLAPKLTIIGESSLPHPETVSLDRANSGALDAQYVSINGIIHPMTFAEEPSHPILTFNIYTSIGQVHVFASPRFPDIRELQSLEDAKVRLVGVFGSIFNSKRQLIGYQINVSSPQQIKVLERSESDVRRIPTTTIASLLKFVPSTRSGHRVKVKGTITLADKTFVFVQDGTAGVEVHTDQSPASIGENVEVVGYPRLEGGYSPILTDSEVHRVGNSSLTPALHTNAEQLLRGSHESELVSVDAMLVGFVREPTSDHLLLQAGSHSFSAHLDTIDHGHLPDTIRERSMLRLTGVASAQVDAGRIHKVLNLDPVAFSILLRSPEDVKILRSAPFWTVGRSLLVLSILALLTLGILAWVAVLRRRVLSQTAALEKASQTAQAINDLSVAMEKISEEERFDSEVSVRGNRYIAQLVIVFNRMLVQLRQRDRAKRDAEQKLQLQALFDELSGLPNRRLLADRISQSLAAARRDGSSIALLYIDLDGFKQINDSFGHHAGDSVLRETAQRLRARIREVDTLARLGGDEFAVIANQVGTREHASKLAESLLHTIGEPFVIQGHSITIGASIGIGMYPDGEEDSHALLEQADCAMYAAKRDGKNRVVFFSNEVGLSVRNRFTLENELRNALNNQQIMVHYQPEFDLASNTIVCFEALARWTHPELGYVSPAQFIPVAEESGLIAPLGNYVMERACREALSWQAFSEYPLRVGVNVSTQQFARNSFIQEVEQILEKTGFPPTLLQIELTESAMLRGIQRASDTLKHLRSMGISVAIDDFGTGYSCLSYLPKLAFDALKIDRSFVQELGEDHNATALVQSIVGLARNLRMRVIVEGIENENQLAIVKRLGGQDGQGYLLGRPTPDPKALLRRQKRLGATISDMEPLVCQV